MKMNEGIKKNMQKTHEFVIQIIRDNENFQFNQSDINSLIGLLMIICFIY